MTDALNLILSDFQVFGFGFSGEHFDIGTPQGLLDASNYYLLNHWLVCVRFFSQFSVAIVYSSN